jgi:hypothetical protein
MRKILLMTIGLTAFVLAADFSRDSSTGVVTDNTTGLQWQDDTNATSQTWEGAITYCEGLPLDGSGWRLPNINELTSIVNDGRGDPAIYNTFKYTDSNATDYYWTSTTNDANQSEAWRVRFVTGDHFYGNKTVSEDVNVSNKVRCVRTLPVI